MQRVRVSSSSIAAIGFDREASVLEVEFLNGRVYQYRGVPADEHQALMIAESIGTHMNERIKGKYPFVQVDVVRKNEG